MIILESMFSLFALIIVLAALEFGYLMFKGKSLLITTLYRVNSIRFNIFKSKSDSIKILKEIKNKLSRYEDEYSNWNKKVSRFQLEVYYEIERIINTLDNSNDESQMEFNYTYRETVLNIYKILKENEFIVTKKQHDKIYIMLKELSTEAKDILEISNTVNSIKNEDLLSIDMDYIKQQREKRQLLKGE